MSICSFCAKKPHWQIPLIVDNVTRAGAVSLSKSLSNEMGRFGITVNTIGPGFIDTEMAVDWMRSMSIEQGKDPDLDEVYDEIIGRMQTALTALAEERRLPVIG